MFTTYSLIGLYMYMKFQPNSFNSVQPTERKQNCINLRSKGNNLKIFKQELWLLCRLSVLHKCFAEISLTVIKVKSEHNFLKDWPCGRKFVLVIYHRFARFCYWFFRCCTGIFRSTSALFRSLTTALDNHGRCQDEPLGQYSYLAHDRLLNRLWNFIALIWRFNCVSITVFTN